MKKFIFILIIILFLSSCISENVIIRATTDKGIHEITVKRNIEIFKVFILFEKVEKIEGIPKLKNLKKLYILGMYGIIDYSFLGELNKLEILIMETSDVKTFDFLTFLPNLKILYLDGVTLMKNEIDLSKNNQLEYLALFNLHTTQSDTYFDLNLINIPKNIQFIDLSLNKYVKLSKKMFDRTKDVPTILLEKKYYHDNEQVLKNYNNIYFGDNKKILPQKYWDETLFEEPKDILYEAD